MRNLVYGVTQPNISLMRSGRYPPENFWHTVARRINVAVEIGLRKPITASTCNTGLLIWCMKVVEVQIPEATF